MLSRGSHWGIQRRFLARALHPDDVACLLDERLTGIQRYEGDLSATIERVLHENAANGLSHSTLSRFIDGPAYGYVGAHLIRNEVAEEIFERGIADLVFDRRFAVPLSDEDLRLRNISRVGSTLLVSNFLWYKKIEPGGEALFLQHALEHLTRWFVGNAITGILFCYHDDFALSLDSHIKRVYYAVVSKRYTKQHPYWLAYVKADSYEPGYADQEWMAKLLNDYYYYLDGSISDTRKLQGRALYEFDFDVVQAVERCMPNWSINEGKRLACPSMEAWRKDVALDLRINPEGLKRYPTMVEIEQRIKVAPAILALC